jgi:hypothetical protein
MSRILRPHGSELSAPGRVERGRRDFTSRELFAMADEAAAGRALPNSSADGMLRTAMARGDFERAAAIVREIKERAPDLRRLARAADRAERRAARRRRS